MAFAIVSDKPLGKRETFVQEMLNALDEQNAQNIAMVARLPGGNVMTAYFNMDLQDKQLASAQIDLDVMDDMFMANRDRYLLEEDENE